MKDQKDVAAFGMQLVIKEKFDELSGQVRQAAGAAQSVDLSGIEKTIGDLKSQIETLNEFHQAIKDEKEAQQKLEEAQRAAQKSQPPKRKAANNIGSAAIKAAISESLEQVNALGVFGLIPLQHRSVAVWGIIGFAFLIGMGVGKMVSGS